MKCEPNSKLLNDVALIVAIVAMILALAFDAIMATRRAVEREPKAPAVLRFG